MTKLVDDSGMEEARRESEAAREPLPSRKALQAALAAQTRTTADRDAQESLPRRRPVFGSRRLGVNCDRLQQAGYYCHWVNDYPGRLSEAEESGYTFVTQDEVQQGHTSGAQNAASGNRVSRRVGVDESGKELLAYLMKIPQDWKDENDAYYQERADLADNAIRKGKTVPVERSYLPGDEPIKMGFTTRTR